MLKYELRVFHIVSDVLVSFYAISFLGNKSSFLKFQVFPY